VSRGVPLLANLKPSGKYVMEDFYYAGGLRALLRQLASRLHLAAPTVNGRTLGENIADAEIFNADVIRGLDRPVSEAGGTAVLHGSLAPDGAVIKPTAAEPRLWRHQGPAVVFKDIRDLKARIDGDDLAVTPDSVLVLQNAGPVGAPGMPEWGQLPVPRKLLRQGVRDIVRISDARMSGTSYGACILHVSPEAAVGGPFALVRTGDMIELDVPARQLNMAVSEDELARRKSEWRPKPLPPRGYGRMFAAHIQQAHEGCDFDFLEGTAATPEPDIF